MDGTAMTAPTGSIVLAFPADSPTFTKQFSVRAVDLNGNMSESTLVDVTYEAPPDEGCNVGASASPAPMLLALALCTLGRRRRRVA
jgi:MYXO-CTERM domain-containing protein